MAKAKTITVAPTGPRIYVGPSFPDGYLKKYMVFANGIPLPGEEILKAHPELNSLIVSTSDFTKAIAQISKKGTLLNTVYQGALAIIKGE